MKKSDSFFNQKYQEFATLYRHHAGRDWQQFFANNALLVAAVGLLFAAVGYGVAFGLTGSHQAELGMLDFAIAKIAVTALYILEGKKRVAFGGPALVLILLGLGALTAPHSVVDPAAITVFAISTLLTGLLYGFWRALLPASCSALILTLFWADRLQSQMMSVAHGHITPDFGILIVPAIVLCVSAFTGGHFHTHYTLWRERNSQLPDQPQALLQTHDLIVDAQRREVTRRNAVITLRRKEYDILEYLMRHKGRVVPKQEVVEAAWGQGIKPCSLSVHIKHLRDKVDKPFDIPLIETKHGIGYSMKDLPTSEE